MKWVPNALSYSRLLIGSVVVAMLKISGHPTEAFFSALGFASTDFFDGYFAKLLGVDQNKNLDPVCDFGFALGILTGFVWEDGPWHPDRFWLAVSIVFFTVVFKWLKHRHPQKEVREIAYGVSAYNYVSWVTFFVYNYAVTGINPTVTNWLYFPLAFGVVIAKRHRFADWNTNIRNGLNGLKQKSRIYV